MSDTVADYIKSIESVRHGETAMEALLECGHVYTFRSTPGISADQLEDIIRSGILCTECAEAAGREVHHGR